MLGKNDPPFWVTADKQETGRGRLGRHWVSEPGNLYASLILAKPAPPDRIGTLGLVIGVALRNAITVATGWDGFHLKWPNDVLFDGAKVSGLLIEGFVRDRTPHVVIGCGVNCTHHPTDTPYPTTDLAALGFPVEPLRLFEHLRDETDRALAAWNRGVGFGTIRSQWLAHAAGLGRPALVSVPGGKLQGMPRTIDDDGRLILDTETGTERIAAGDLYPSLVRPSSE